MSMLNLVHMIDGAPIVTCWRKSWSASADRKPCIKLVDKIERPLQYTRIKDIQISMDSKTCIILSTEGVLSSWDLQR